jgi:NAD(P)-dependent dehydrogenase (short-subunit alcohol dehydrogenase family)
MRQPSDETIADKTVLITGANTGIGRTAALALAKRGATVIVTARTEAKAQPVVDEIVQSGGRAHPWALELSDLAAVAESAKALLASDHKLDIVIFNAGLAGQPGLSKQGFEITFAVNHLGHFLLGEMLMPRLRAHGQARVVIVASGNHYRVKKLDFSHVRERTRTLTGLVEYDLSKLANVMTAIDWSRMNADAGVQVVSLNPGQIASDIWRRIPNPFRWLYMQTMRTVEQGAYTTVHCAVLSPQAIESGAYYHDCAVRAVNPLALDDTLRAQLRERSLEWISPYLS